jgi:hypothetical protein
MRGMVLHALKEPVVAEDDLYMMSSLAPKDTGLPLIVWISEKGAWFPDAEPRVWVSRSPIGDHFVASVSVRRPVEVREGELEGPSLDLLTRWINLNRPVIIGHWTGRLSAGAALHDLKPV